MSRRRRFAGLLLAVAGLPLLTLLASACGLGLTGDIPLFLAAVVAVALAGGLWPALLAAVGGFLLLNYYFVAPLHTLRIATVANLLALAVFVVVALAVSWVVDLAARRTRQAVQATAEARTLASVAGSVLTGTDPLRALLGQLRDTFALSSVTLLERTSPGTWHAAASVGSGSPSPDAGPPPRTAPTPSWAGPSKPAGYDNFPPSSTGEDPAGRSSSTGEDPAGTSSSTGDDPAGPETVGQETVVPIDRLTRLVLVGPELPPSGRRIVRAVAAQAAVALRQQRLAVAAEGDRVRTALLAAVGHDLRTPLASAKAAVAGLRSPDVDFDEKDRAELLATAEESLDRLAGLVANLLDMSRLQAGTLGMTPADIGLEDVVPRALDELGPDGREVAVDLPDDLPAVRADPGLLERVLVNLTGNALRYSPPGRPPAVTGSAHGDLVEVRITDHGPGIPENKWEQVFLPFQRLGDRGGHDGVGLGLALSRGLAEAMGGTLVPSATPGGGLTMILLLPAAPPGAEDPGGRPARDTPPEEST